MAGKERLLKEFNDFKNRLAQNHIDKALTNSQKRRAAKNCTLMCLSQILLDQPVELNDAIYNYSMLYPLTDDIIDNPELKPEDKKRFVNNINLVLQGKPTNEIEKVFVHHEKYKGYEERTYELLVATLSAIPEDNRESAALALIGVNLTQQESIKQLKPGLDENTLVETIKKVTPEFESENFDIIARKGASATLATAHLLNNTGEPLKEDVAAFFALTGVIIQLYDDLNDTQKDFANKTVTPANIDQIRSGNANSYARKTLAYIDDKLRQFETLYPNVDAKKGKLILNALRLKVVSVITDPGKTEQGIFSENFARRYGAGKSGSAFNVYHQVTGSIRAQYPDNSGVV